MKYIMFRDKNGRKIPFIFPTTFVHSDVAKVLSDLIDGRVVSAGEINISVDNCFGKSTTLGVGVIKGDAKSIDEHDYFFGIENTSGIDVKTMRELFKKLKKDDNSTNKESSSESNKS